MKKGLPESYAEFARDLEFHNFASWDYKKVLGSLLEYSRIKKLEAEERWVLSDVELLVKGMCAAENECAARLASNVIPYTEILNGRLPRSIIDLQGRIWFLPILAAKRPEAFNKLESRYSSYFYQKISGKNCERTRALLFELLIDYERRYVHDLVFDAVDIVPLRPVDKISVAKVKYPGIADANPSVKSILSLKKKSVTIGLGIESSFKENRLAKEVKIDENTKSSGRMGRSVIYTPGWSINGAFDDGND